MKAYIFVRFEHDNFWRLSLAAWMSDFTSDFHDREVTEFSKNAPYLNVAVFCNNFITSLYQFVAISHSAKCFSGLFKFIFKKLILTPSGS
jgi:hypothetical protein